MANVPTELQELHQWLVWKYEGRGKKRTKKPYSCTGDLYGRLASSTDSSTWASFADAELAFTRKGSPWAGVGFVFSKNDPYFGIDLDDCIDDEGNICESARKIIDACSTYTEISPSGHGVKLFAKGMEITTGVNRKNPDHPDLAGIGGVEMYSHGRYFTITGRHVDGTPADINDCGPAGAELLEKISKRKAKPATPPPPPPPKQPSPPSGRLSALERCRRYVAKLPDAISGENGHDKTYAAACKCFEFGLSEAEAWQVMQEFNAHKTGGEMWDDYELKHKLESAYARVMEDGEFGQLRDAERVVTMRVGNAGETAGKNGHRAAPKPPPPRTNDHPRAADVALEWLRTLDPQHHRDRKSMYLSTLGKEIPVTLIWMLAPDALVDRMTQTREGQEMHSAKGKPPDPRKRLSLLKDSILLAAGRLMANLPDVKDAEIDPTIDADELLAQLVGWLLRERTYRSDIGVPITTTIYGWASAIDPRADGWMQCHTSPVWARMESATGTPMIAVKGEFLRGELRRDTLRQLGRELRSTGLAVTDTVIKVTSHCWRVWQLAPTVIDSIATRDGIGYASESVTRNSDEDEKPHLHTHA